MTKDNSRIERVSLSLSELRRRNRERVSTKVGFQVSISKADEILVSNYKRMMERDKNLDGRLIIGIDLGKKRRKR